MRKFRWIWMMVISASAIALAIHIRGDDPSAPSVSRRKPPIKDDTAEAAGRYSATYKTYVSAGFPCKVSDVSNPTDDDLDNAASYLSPAIEKIQTRYETSPDETKTLSDYWKDGQTIARIERSREHDTILGLAIDASGLSFADFHASWLHTDATNDDGLKYTPKLVQWFCDRARKQAADRNGEEAAKNLNVAWRLGMLIAQYQPIESQLSSDVALEDVLYEVEVCATELALSSAAKESIKNGGPTVSFSPIATFTRNGQQIANSPLSKQASLNSTSPAMIDPTAKAQLEALKNNLNLPFNLPSLIVATKRMIFTQILKSSSLALDDSNQEITVESPGEVVKPVALTRIAQAETTHVMEFWIGVRPLLDRLDSSLEASKSIDSSIRIANKNKTPSGKIIARTPLVFEKLWIARANLKQFLDADDALLDCLLDRLTTGRWPTSIAEISGFATHPFQTPLTLTPSGDSITIDGPQALFTPPQITRTQYNNRAPQSNINTEIRAVGMPRGLSSIYGRQEATFPFVSSPKDRALAQDKAWLAAQPKDDTALMSAKLPEIVRACAKANFPRVDSSESSSTLDMFTGDLGQQLELAAKTIDSNTPDPGRSQEWQAFLPALAQNSEGKLLLSDAAQELQVVDIYRFIAQKKRSAESAAANGHGAEAAIELNHAWSKLDKFDSHPELQPGSLAPRAIADVATSVENAATSLAPNPREFSLFSQTLKISKDPISVSKLMPEAIGLQLRQSIIGFNVTEKLGDKALQLYQRQTADDQAKIAGFLQFWYQKMPLILNWDSAPMESSLKLAHAFEQLKKTNMKSSGNWSLMQPPLSNLCACYTLRDGELLLLKCIQFHSSRNVWPSSLDQIPGTSFAEKIFWHLSQSGANFQLNGKNSWTPGEVSTISPNQIRMGNVQQLDNEVEVGYPSWGDFKG